MKTSINYPEVTMYRAIADKAAEFPDAPAYSFYNKKTDFKTFLGKIDRAARSFQSMGLTKGDAVTLCLPNTPQALDAFYAISKCGLVANMIHPLSARDEVVFYLNISQSKVIVTVDLFYEKVTDALKDVDHPVEILVTRMQDELPLPLKIAFIAKKGKDFLKFPRKGEGLLWSDFLRRGDKLPDAQEIEFERDRTAVILYSGGTSGTPKGIELTDFNMMALAYQCLNILPFPFRPGLKMLSCMPMFHGFGLGVNLHTALTFGVECILMPSFNNKSYADALIKKKPNFIAGVPTIFESLLHMPQLEGKSLDHLMGVFCGGDSLSVELKKKVDAFLKEHGSNVVIQEGYGLTECVTVSCLTPFDQYKEGSIGVPYPDMEYAIVAPGTDDVLPAMEEGEIIITGPTLMKGYLKNPEETAKTLRVMADGRTWLYTGDLGYMDEDGFVYFRQRIKRMIISKGYNIYPGQIENVIDSLPEVAYSCIIGVKDEHRGQRVQAYIVLQEGVPETDATRELIMKKLRTCVALYALPKEIFFRRELPRTLVGKVAYRKLEEEANAAQAEAEAQEPATNEA
ncbi:MAG: class I adenylate-forming enzyme family protein [Lachnospiraceae bacterium]|nr:class I adenylate-forming enzyme family protein [Lachnospiraceae bacterium]